MYRVLETTLNEPVRRRPMGTWFIDSPQRLTLDGDVGQLDVWFAQGKLRVIGAEGPARVEINKVGRKGINITLENGLLSVRHPITQRWWHWGNPFWWFFGGRRNYTADAIIAVPPTVTSSLTVVAGDIVASGLRQGVAVDVTSGSITVMGLGGAVRTKTVSGSIEAMGVSGDLVMETVSGEISLAESSAERVRARTISGAVTCDLDNPFAREVHIDTTSGSITIRVPEDADLNVSLGATSGRVTSVFPQIRPAGMPGAHSASGQIGSGSGTLRAYAVSGSVSLLASPAGDFGRDSDEDGSA
jgi:hypothetical protein